MSLDYALPKPHDAALTGAAVVYTEADLALDVSQMVGLLWSSGPGLSTRISPERWDAVAIAARDTLPAPLLEHLAPWALASILPLVLPAKDPRDLADTPSMDAEIQKRARARDIPVRHVETLEQQAALLKGLDDVFLAEIGPTDAALAAAAADALTALCFRADLSVSDVITEPGNPVSDVLLGARNRAWVPTLRPALDAGGAFVAVGAGHMLGDAGLVALLRAEGFTVTQLTTTRPVTDARMPGGDAVIPPAPPARADLAALVDRVVPPIAASLCDDGQVIRTCFAPDGDTCRARIEEDAALCVRQHADTLPADGTVPPRFSSAVATCAPTGLILDAVGRGAVTDSPVCALLEGAMRSGGK